MNPVKSDLTSYVVLTIYPPKDPDTGETRPPYTMTWDAFHNENVAREQREEDEACERRWWGRMLRKHR